MATGLAEQLRRLRAPQTTVLQQNNKKPSILFHPKEAANLDREAVYNIGISGLEELIKYRHQFIDFKQTIFSRKSINIVRSKLTNDANEKLNKDVKRFLVLVSPYFMDHSATKAIEWLIHRFQIHDYNKDDYVLLILPYHGSNLFARAVQVLDLSNTNDKWRWLKPIAKSGTHLPSISLVHQVKSDDGLLKMICNHVLDATKINSEYADTMTTLYSFFTTTLVGWIEITSSITEVQINHVLQVLLKGLSSSVKDFAASTYMIIAKIISKTNLMDDRIEKLFLKALKKPALANEVILLLLFICNESTEDSTIISENLILQLAEKEKSWFVDSLLNAQNSGAKIVNFITFFFNAAFQYIATNFDTANFEENNVLKIVDDILTKITFKEEEILMILTNTLNKNVMLIKDSGTAKKYFDELYQSLERRYPTSFDKFLHNLMQSDKSKSEINQEILQYITSWFIKSETSCDIFTGLNHVDSKQRILAIHALGSKEFKIPDNLQEIVNKSLLARLNDDNDKVIIALLNLPINLLQKCFATDTLVDELLILVSKCFSKHKRDLAAPALKVLLELCDESDDTSVFLVTVPYLFPVKEKDVLIVRQILESDFAKRSLYFKSVAQEIGDSTSLKNIREVAFHYFLKDANLLPPAEDILSAIKYQMNHGNAASVFFNMIILGSVCRIKNDKKSALDFKIARQAIEVAAEMIRNFPSIVPLSGATHINAEKLPDALNKIYEGHLPLQVNTYVLEMVHRYYGLKAPINSTKFDFEDDYEKSQLVLSLIEIVFEGMSIEVWRKNYPAWKSHYEWYLDIFFRRHFKSKEDLICFLSKLFMKPVKPETSFYCLNICSSLLDGCQSFQWAFHNDTFIINLLLALGSENKACRQVAVNILKKLLQTFNISMGGYSELLSEIIDRNLEISMDENQLLFILWHLLSPDPGVKSSLGFGSKKQKRFEKIRDMLFNVILSEDSPIHIRSQLLELLTLVNGPEILKKLIPFGYKLLQKIDQEDKIFARNAIKNILQRFDSVSVEALMDEKVWNFFMECLTNNTHILVDDAMQHLSVIILKQVDDVFFYKLGEISQELQKKFLAKLVDIVTDCEIATILSKIPRLIKKLKINAQLIVEELKFMINLEEEAEKLTVSKGTLRKRKSISKIKSSLPPEIVNSRKWKRGVTLLEFIQHSDNIENEVLLLPILFDLLKISISFEEQSPVEYTNQLVLSTIYNLATKSVPIKNADSYIDLIAQCIRTSHNPQTHHHALLVLVELFKVADIQRALQNIMPIFTFMGNTVLRQDDAYSIQIITKAIETIIPIINAENNMNHIYEILKLFITSLPDIPEHRRVPLFLKLLQLLENHLHLYYLLTFESHVLSKNIDSSQETSEKLRFALIISQEFSVEKIMQVCVKLVEFLAQLPVEKDHMSNFSGNQIFDVEHNSPKQLRHYKFTIVRFIISLLSSSEFINRVAEINENEIETLKPFYDKLIVQLVIFIQNTSRNAELNQGKPNGKYWKVMLHGLYDVLDLVNNLLPNNIFIESTAQLLGHDSLTVKRKVLELLNARLYQKKFSIEDYDDLLALVDPLTIVLNKPSKLINPEIEIMQQTALITLKLLAKLLAQQYSDVFKPILDLATTLVETRDGAVLGSAVLCVAELCSSMKIHSITRLNTFMPAIIRLLKKYCNQEIPDILTLSIVSALHKIVESVGNFLSLYLDQLLFELTRLNFLYTDSQHQKIGPVVSRLKATTQKLSTCIPLRVLLPSVDKTYDGLINSKAYQCIPPLMDILSESFNKVEISELSNGMPNLITFFLKVLQFREKVIVSNEEMEIDEEVTSKDVSLVEESSSNALISLILRLSEGTVRPLFYKIYDWAARNPQYKQRNITFYRLTANIAEGLKFLFTPFAGHFLKHAAELLKGNNIINCEEGSYDTTMENETSRIELIEQILLTLSRVFLFNDTHDFVNQERFDILMQPLVDQIENIRLSDDSSERNEKTIEEFEKRAKELIVPCIASFVNDIPDDSLHKQLVYQVLLKTRHNKPCVRHTALNAVVEIARKLGQDFMPLLPETIPFIRELLEDDEETEKNAQNAVRDLTEILDVPLQNYF